MLNHIVQIKDKNLLNHDNLQKGQPVIEKR